MRDVRTLSSGVFLLMPAEGGEPAFFHPYTGVSFRETTATRNLLLVADLVFRQQRQNHLGRAISGGLYGPGASLRRPQPRLDPM